uniref:SFRP2 secreted frizzled-related protein n=1 Tax=Phallusia mammillata TaxID=59560 RepID=A0A6F9DS62_9ASCI|nr:sFRP2 secreted frizzled-related protein precursor [Phallusia mammillata]
MHNDIARFVLCILFAVSKSCDGKKPVKPDTDTVNRQPPAIKSIATNPSFLLPDLDVHQTQCMLIPVDFDLCYGMEYNRMRFPNLLGHETMQEVLQQASDWPPLVAARCHPETRKFLCTLFAPVCMKDYQKAIPPCRSLCTAVRDSCNEKMRNFGYSWPPMLNCSSFPVNDGSKLCIPENPPPPQESPVCDPCQQRRVKEALRRKICSFDFIVKIRVKRVTHARGKTKIVARRKTTYKWPKSTKKPKKFAIWMKDGFLCSCPVLDNNKASYLVAGRESGKNVELLHITQWSKKLKKRIRNRLKRCRSKT